MEFLDEMRFMKNLGYHAHLLNMLGCVSDVRDPKLVVEFCEHGDLLRILRHNKMRLKQVRQVFDDSIRENIISLGRIGFDGRELCS